MLIQACIAKIHRATVTQAELNYVGSITIDKKLLEASGIKEFQYVNINNLSNAVHWRTYVMAGPEGKGDICLNGPPAQLFHPGDKIIILAECLVTPEEMKTIEPIVVFVDDKNAATKIERHSQIKN